MSEKVVMEYEFYVVAGKGNSSATSLAKQAYHLAKDFYGELPFTVHVDVSGKKLEYYVKCTARAEIEVTTNGR